jgi:hypothetical protein
MAAHEHDIDPVELFIVSMGLVMASITLVITNQWYIKRS